MFHLDENGVRRRRTKWSIALDDTQLDKLDEAMFFWTFGCGARKSHGPLILASGNGSVNGGKQVKDDIVYLQFRCFLVRE